MRALFIVLGMLFSTTAVAREQDPQEELIAAVPDNFPPYYMLDNKGQPSGFAIDTMGRLAAMAGFRIRYLIKPDWDSAMDALRQGEADLIPNLGITPERAKYFDFTAPLETFGLGLFVRSVNTDIHDMDELRGRVVAVVRRNAAVKFLADYPRINTRLYDHQEQALFALLSGEVDAFVYPITVTWKMASDIGVDERIRQAGLPLMEIKRAVAVLKGNQVLLTRLDRAVQEYTRSEQFSETYSRWHSTPEVFWTIGRVLRYGFIIVIAVLALTVLALLWWRRLSIAKLEYALQDSLNALERHRSEIAQLKEQVVQAQQQTGKTANNTLGSDKDAG